VTNWVRRPAARPSGVALSATGRPGHRRLFFGRVVLATDDDQLARQARAASMELVDRR